MFPITVVFVPIPTALAPITIWFPPEIVLVEALLPIIMLFTATPTPLPSVVLAPIAITPSDVLALLTALYPIITVLLA